MDKENFLYIIKSLEKYDLTVINNSKEFLDVKDKSGDTIYYDIETLESLSSFIVGYDLGFEVVHESQPVKVDNIGTKFYCHTNGFSDTTLMVALREDGSCYLVRKDGTTVEARAYTKERIDFYVSRGDWAEITF
jgi:hypothetical protein